jgi:hypothetical protein
VASRWPWRLRFAPPAVAAIVLSGQRIERKEIGAPGEFDALTDDELERAVIERLSALGLNTDCGSDTRD